MDGPWLPVLSLASRDSGTAGHSASALAAKRKLVKGYLGREVVGVQSA